MLVRCYGGSLIDVKSGSNDGWRTESAVETFVRNAHLDQEVTEWLDNGERTFATEEWGDEKS